MPRILIVTRPEPQAAAFAKSVERMFGTDWRVLVAPLVRIVPLPFDLDLAGVAALAFTSQNAVACFAAAEPRRDLPVYAVGARTADAARDAGFQQVAAAGGDATALQALLMSQAPFGGALLHVRGLDSAGDLADALTAAGIEARSVVAYRQEALPLPEAAATALREGHADAVALFSPNGARVFAETIARAALPPPPIAFCISEAAARPVRGCGIRRIEVAARPNAAAILELMRQSTA